MKHYGFGDANFSPMGYGTELAAKRAERAVSDAMRPFGELSATSAVRPKRDSATHGWPVSDQERELLGCRAFYPRREQITDGLTIGTLDDLFPQLEDMPTAPEYVSCLSGRILSAWD